jgi:hypothetical protein
VFWNCRFTLAADEFFHNVFAFFFDRATLAPRDTGRLLGMMGGLRLASNWDWWDWLGTGTGFTGTKHEETAQEETLE